MTPRAISDHAAADAAYADISAGTSMHTSPGSGHAQVHEAKAPDAGTGITPPRFRYPVATSRIADALPAGHAARRAADTGARLVAQSRQRAMQGVAAARRVGGRVYGEAERRLVPGRLRDRLLQERNWKKRAALQVLSVFMVSLSLGLIGLNAVVMFDAPSAQAAPVRPVHAVEAMTPLRPAVAPPQGYVAHAMGRYSATLPRPALQEMAPAAGVADQNGMRHDEAVPTHAEMRRRYAEYRAQFEAQNRASDEDLVAAQQRADQAARTIATQTPAAPVAAPLPAAAVQQHVDPAAAGTPMYDPADVAASAAAGAY